MVAGGVRAWYMRELALTYVTCTVPTRTGRRDIWRQIGKERRSAQQSSRVNEWSVLGRIMISVELLHL